MKKRKTIILIVASVLLLSSFTALASTVFFVTNSLGFRCTGQGSLSGQSYSASFSTLALPGTSVQLDEAYSSEIVVLLYNSAGSHTAHIGYGNRTCSLSGTEGTITVDHSYSAFEFEGVDLGAYYLYN